MAFFFLVLFVSQPLFASEKKEVVLKSIEKGKGVLKSCKGNTLGVLFLDDRLAIVPPFPKRTKKENQDYLRTFKQNVLSPESLRAGLEFITAHEKELVEIETKYRVDRHVLAGLFRVETDFGKEMGEATPASALYTMYVRGKKKVALREIKALCRLVDRGIDPHLTRSSVAGAFGLPQFMPASYLDFGVDGSGDGNIDLFTWEDAIPSAAHFLNRAKFHKNPRKALLRYNPWGFYADLILEYRTTLKKFEHMGASPHGSSIELRP